MYICCALMLYLIVLWQVVLHDENNYLTKNLKIKAYVYQYFKCGTFSKAIVDPPSMFTFDALIFRFIHLLHAISHLILKVFSEVQLRGVSLFFAVGHKQMYLKNLWILFN